MRELESYARVYKERVLHSLMRPQLNEKAYIVLVRTHPNRNGVVRTLVRLKPLL